MTNTVEISLDLYEKYVTLYEKFSIIRRYLKHNNYISDDDLRLILEIKKEPEETEAE